MRIFFSLAYQHIIVASRSGYALLAVAFLFMVSTLLPFGVGADLLLLRKIAPGLLWVVLLIALLLSLEHLFHSDRDDGSLDQIFLLPIAPELAIAAKILGHFIAIVVPLLLAIPIAGLLLNVQFSTLPILGLSMVAGAPALTLLGALGAALSVSVRRGALLTVLIVMPFYVPIVIIGTVAAPGISLIILASMSVATCLLVPFAIIAALRDI